MYSVTFLCTSPIDISQPDPHSTGWVDWNKMGKVSCSRKQQPQKMAWLGIESGTSRLPDPYPNNLAMLVQIHIHHTNTHTHMLICMHTHTCACAHAHTRACTRTHTCMHTHTHTRCTHATHTHTLYMEAHAYTQTQTHYAQHCTHTNIYLHDYIKINISTGGIIQDYAIISESM